MDTILNAISDGFSIVFNWLFKFVFVDMHGNIKYIGSSLFTLLFNNISGLIFSFDFIYIFCGFVIFFVFLKIIINLIRG